MVRDYYESTLQMLREAERQYKEQFKNISISEGLKSSLERADEISALVGNINDYVGKNALPDWIQDNYRAVYGMGKEGYQSSILDARVAAAATWEDRSVQRYIEEASNKLQFLPEYLVYTGAVSTSSVVEDFIEFEKTKASFFDRQYGIDQTVIRDRLLLGGVPYDFDMNYIQKELVVSLDEVRAAGLSRVYNMDDAGLVGGTEGVNSVYEHLDWDRIAHKYSLGKYEVCSLKEDFLAFDIDEKKDIRNEKIHNLINSVSRVTKDKKNSILLFSASLTNPTRYLSNSGKSALWLILLLLVTGIIDKELVKSFLFNTATIILLKDLIKDK